MHDSVRYESTYIKINDNTSGIILQFSFNLKFIFYFSALTVEDEKRQIGNLICGLVQRVDYGRDFEKQLNFYAESRAAFPNLDSVHVQLVQVKDSIKNKN